MIKRLFTLTILVAMAFVVNAQEDAEKKKINIISRSVEGEIRTLYNDTLYGKITVRAAQDYYITSITFKEKGKKEVVYSAVDIKRFKQTVPFPDRAEFGVEEVYFESAPNPRDPYKKVFLPMEKWK